MSVEEGVMVAVVEVIVCGDSGCSWWCGVWVVVVCVEEGVIVVVVELIVCGDSGCSWWCGV